MYSPPGRDIAALLPQHAESIAALKASLGPSLNRTPDDTIEYDDIWLLRFILSSKGDMNKAERNAKKTLDWRREKHVLMQDAMKGGTFDATFDKYCPGSIHGISASGDVVFLLRAGLSNLKALMNEVDEERAVDVLMYRRELLALKCNEETRRTGRLCKTMIICDLNHTGLAQLNRRFSNVIVKTSKMSEIYYPQLLANEVLMNMPKMVVAFFRMVKGLLPKAAQEKLTICPGRTLTQNIATCPFVRSHFDVEHLPSFLGGRCHCHDSAGCIPGMANEQSVTNLESNDAGMSKWSVPRRGSYDAFLAVVKNAVVNYSIEVDQGIVSSGPLMVKAILHCKDEKKEIVLIQDLKCEPGKELDGHVDIPQSGTLVVTFTNKSSLWSQGVQYHLIAT